MGTQHIPSESVDLSVPSVARIYDYAIGGKDDFEVDWEATRQIAAFWPDTYRVSQQNRAWLHRAAHCAAEQGITQFLAYGRALLDADGKTEVAQGDMARPEDLLADERVQRLLDLSRPVAVLYVSALHCIPDERDPMEIPRRIMAAMPSGSHLILSRLRGRDQESGEALTNFFKALETTWGRGRSESEIASCFRRVGGAAARTGRYC